jgi:hypothetical protein
VLQLSESIGREVVEIIVGEVVLSICVASHTARSSSGAVQLLTLLSPEQWHKCPDISKCRLWGDAGGSATSDRLCTPSKDLHVAPAKSAQPGNELVLFVSVICSVLPEKKVSSRVQNADRFRRKPALLLTRIVSPLAFFDQLVAVWPSQLTFTSSGEKKLARIRIRQPTWACLVLGQLSRRH